MHNSHEDETILCALRISRRDLVEDMNARIDRLIAHVADDVRDLVPCSLEFFETEIPRLHGLDVMNSDEDARTSALLLSRLIRYQDEKHDAPFLVVFSDESVLRGAEVVDRRMLPIAAASPDVLPPVRLGLRRVRHR